jgi:putative ABC transport system permease protein
MTQFLQSFVEDIVYSVRGLRRDPFLAFAATITLAVSIGANTAVFSIADSILIRPLPYPNSGRIDWISERAGPAREDIAVAPDYYQIRDQNRIFEDVAEFGPLTLNWTGVERPEQLDAASASVSFFRVMGAPPLLGRYFARDEEGPKAPPVVVLSYAFWHNRLGSDAHVLGKAIALDRLPRTIIGVAPQGFDFPHGAQLWIPSALDESSQRTISATRLIFVVSIVARRKPDVTPQHAAAEMSRFTLLIRAQYASEFRKTSFRSDLTISAAPLQQHLTGQVRPALLMLTGAVSLVLLIACVNLANLLLARAIRRRRELAVRLAIGSSRSRIVRQMLTESLVLALPGGVVGMGLGWAAARLLDAVKPGILARYPPIAVDLRVLAFTAVLTLATSLLFGMAPAWSAGGIHLLEALKSAGLSHSPARGAARLRRVLVVAELAISLVLLIGAGLLARSFLHLARVEPGFRSDHLLTFRLNPIGPLDRDYAPFYARVLDQVRHLPAARSATLAADIPLGDDDFYADGRIRVIDRPPVPFTERPIARNTVVSPEFFHTLEIPLEDGRIFDSHDSPAARQSAVYTYLPAEPVVVNRAFVKLMFRGESALGRRLGFGPDDYNITWTIVGVVSNIRSGALGADPPPVIYRCTCAGLPVFRAAFLLRTAGDPRNVIGEVGRQVRAVERDQPIFDVKTMDERRDAALAPERFQLILMGVFAAIAIFLAAAGVYGVMSYLVIRRAREIGIRMAMGAGTADVLRIVLGESALLALLAVLLGLGGAWALTRYLHAVLFGVTERDPVTFTVTPILLAVLVMAASLAPARRALHIDPAIALRDE